MIIEILIAQSQAHDPLCDQRLQRVLSAVLITIIGTAGQTMQQMGALLHLSQQETAAIGTDLTTVTPGDDVAPTKAVKFELG